MAKQKKTRSRELRDGAHYVDLISKLATKVRMRMIDRGLPRSELEDELHKVLAPAAWFWRTGARIVLAARPGVDAYEVCYEDTLTVLRGGALPECRLPSAEQQKTDQLRLF